MLSEGKSVLMAHYLIKHTKNDEIKFTGHLDLTKAIQRTISRAGLNIEYSKGFNPHMILSSAQPVPVGQMSECEYLMGEFTEDRSPHEMLKLLNDVSPKGIEFTFIRELGSGKIPPMKALTHIEYEILIPGDDSLKDEISRLILKDSWPFETVSKKGAVRMRDLRTMIKKISAESISSPEPIVRINLLSSAGSEEHLSTDHFLQYIREKTENYPQDRFISVTRKEMYTGNGEDLRPLEDM